MTLRLAASILAADFSALGREIEAAACGGADQVHLDVMDGHFVPNLSIGVPVVKSLRKATTLPLDVHLMITDPDKFVEPFVEAGANMLSVHVEVVPDLRRTISRIQTLGAKAGVALNPSTPVSAIQAVAAAVDFVLVMSVNPGFGGQRFIPDSLAKIRAVRTLLDGAGNTTAAIEVDGGIDLATIGPAVAAGAQWLVAGHAIFGMSGTEAAARALKVAAERAAPGGPR